MYMKKKQNIYYDLSETMQKEKYAEFISILIFVSFSIHRLWHLYVDTVYNFMSILLCLSSCCFIWISLLYVVFLCYVCHQFCRYHFFIICETFSTCFCFAIISIVSHSQFWLVHCVSYLIQM